MPETEEIAKAVQEAAKLGNVSIDTVQKIGGFIAKVFKEPFAELSGIVTDRLKFIRWQRLLKMVDDVNRKLTEKGITNTRAVPPKLALPIFEESSLEEDDNLHSLWSNLLANAMDPNFDNEIRYGYVEMIKNITPTEAQILKCIYDQLNLHGLLDDTLSIVKDNWISKYDLLKFVNIDDNAYEVSMSNLMRIQCISLLKQSTNAGLGPFISKTMELETFALTPLGLKFIEACIN
ncbi:DUF4393 domain-containing protein [bacterium]|nr:DUF4393 domain-containing protein [bacterium]